MNRRLVSWEILPASQLTRRIVARIHRDQFVIISPALGPNFCRRSLHGVCRSLPPVSQSRAYVDINQIRAPYLHAKFEGLRRCQEEVWVEGEFLEVVDLCYLLQIPTRQEIPVYCRHRPAHSPSILPPRHRNCPRTLWTLLPMFLWNIMMGVPLRYLLPHRDCSVQFAMRRWSASSFD